MGEGEGMRNIDVRAEQNINQLPLACSPDQGTNLQPIELATFRFTGALPTKPNWPGLSLYFFTKKIPAAHLMTIIITTLINNLRNTKLS